MCVSLPLYCVHGWCKYAYMYVSRSAAVLFSYCNKFFRCIGTEPLLPWSTTYSRQWWLWTESSLMISPTLTRQINKSEYLSLCLHYILSHKCIHSPMHTYTHREKKQERDREEMWKKLDQLRLDHTAKQSGDVTVTSSAATSSSAGAPSKSSDKPLTNGPTSPPPAPTTSKNPVAADSKRWNHTPLPGTNHSSNKY